MSRIIIEKTATHHWHELVQDAEKDCHQQLGEELESYLVFLLMRFMRKTEISQSVMAERYLRGIQLQGAERNQELQEIGDECLLFSGFFPKIARKRRVSVQYYVELGRSAYDQLSSVMRKSTAPLFQQLAERFIACMEVLDCLSGRGQGREQDLILLTELWQECGSQNAREMLQQEFTGLPVKGNPQIKH